MSEEAIINAVKVATDLAPLRAAAAESRSAFADAFFAALAAKPMHFTQVVGGSGAGQ